MDTSAEKAIKKVPPTTRAISRAIVPPKESARTRFGAAIVVEVTLGS